MKDFSTWILTISIIVYNQVMCSSDFEVFHTSGTGLTSEPVYHHHHYHDEYNQEGGKQKEYDLSGFKRISPKPKFTQTHLYVSPEQAEPHFTRTHSKNGYGDGYSAFLQNNFENNDDDEEVNSKYQQQNYDDDYDGEEETNSKYRNGNEFDRIESLSQKEEVEPKQNPKNCKIIVKGKAMCKLCKDPVSGAHSESCSFSSAPPEKKYAYIKKEKYIS